MRILVTGGAGFIGSAWCSRLLSPTENGSPMTWDVSRVVALDDFSAGSVHAIRACYNSTKFHCVEGSVLDRDLVFDLVRDADVVFHLAAKIHVEESIHSPENTVDVNARGTLHVLEAARRYCPALVVYASSTEVYGSAQTDRIAESHPLCPQSPYAAGKAAGDTVCQAYRKTYGVPVVVLRQFNTYGPGQRNKGYAAVIPTFAARLWSGRPPIIYGDGRQSRDFHYLTDLLRVYHSIPLVYEDIMDSSPVMNFGTGIDTTVNDLAMTMIRMAAQAWKRPQLLELEPVHVEPRPGEVQKLAADASLAKEELGFEPRVNLEDGLLEYLKWYRTRNEFGGEA